MGAGRPSKPLELKVLQGTARADRISKNAVVYQKVNRKPAAPAIIKKMKGGAALWRRVIGQLVDVKMLDEVNIDIVETYIMELLIYKQAMDNVQQLGLLVPDLKTGELKANPARKIASDAMKNFMVIASKFGFNPSDRQKIITDITPTSSTRKKSKKQIEQENAEELADELEL